MRAALCQLCSSDDPGENWDQLSPLIERAAGQGAGIVLTPEVTNCLSASREHQRRVLRREGDDTLLARGREAAARHGIWLSLGSLALLSEGGEGRFVNRSFLISPEGEVAARYDKIHMFDVQISASESFRESSAYDAGDRAVVVPTPMGRIGLTICYDVRFPALYRALAKAGAEVILVPSAFAPTTGAAHWEVLLRARAIECGAFVLAAAQSGEHPSRTDRTRRTYGHSLAISPWGEVLSDAGEAPGLTLVDLDMAEVAQARGRIPSLTHDRDFSGP